MIVLGQQPTKTDLQCQVRSTGQSRRNRQESGLCEPQASAPAQSSCTAIERRSTGQSRRNGHPGLFTPLRPHRADSAPVPGLFGVGRDLLVPHSTAPGCAGRHQRDGLHGSMFSAEGKEAACASARGAGGGCKGRASPGHAKAPRHRPPRDRSRARAWKGAVLLPHLLP